MAIACTSCCIILLTQLAFSVAESFCHGLDVQLVFENCRVPKENVLGGVNNGVRVMMSGLDYEVGWAVGMD
jgi:alkylation response protein AidB-like acyl-CoA dehydrogenase